MRISTPITRDLEILTECLNAPRHPNLCLTRSSKDDTLDTSRRLHPLDISFFKCKSFGHYITNCPTWEKDFKPSRRWKALNCTGFRQVNSHTKLKKKNDTPTASSSSRPATDPKSHAVIESHMKRMSKLAGACPGMTMDSEMKHLSHNLMMKNYLTE